MCIRDRFTVTRIKLLAAPLGIARIDLGEGGGRFIFQTDSKVDPMAIVKLVQNSDGAYRMEGATTLRAKAELPEFEDRVNFCNQLIDQLQS